MTRTASFGFTLCTAITGILVSFVCYAFIDDTDLVQAVASPETHWTVVQGRAVQATLISKVFTKEKRFW